MKKYFFGFLFLLFSACSPNPKPDESDSPPPIQTLNKPFAQKEELNGVTAPQKETDTNETISAKAEENTDTSVATADANAEKTTDTAATSAKAGETIETDVAAADAKAEETIDTNVVAKNQKAEEIPNTDIAANIIVEPNADTSVAMTNEKETPDTDTDTDAVAMNAKAGETADTGKNPPEDSSEELSPATVQQEEIDTDINPGLTTGIGPSTVTVDEGTDITMVQEKVTDRATQESVDFSLEDTLIQEETCEGFSKVNWTNQGLSIEQSIQHFIEEQIQNFLSINREFPSPQDKEDSIRCFVNIAFSLNNIFQIATNHEWKQVPLQVPHKETLIGYIELFIIAHVGFILLPPIKSIPSDRISFVVGEPHLVKTHQYRVVINFNIMSRSKKIIWIVDAQSFPKELALLDISVEGVSILHQLKSQISGLFRKENGDMNEIVLVLQDKINGDPFANW